MKSILGFSDYCATADGKIYSFKRWRCNPTGEKREIKPYKDRRGYLVVSIRNDAGKKKNVFVHQAVALAYIPNPHGYTSVNHKDRNKENNSVDNLEWCSTAQNNRHAATTGPRMAGVSCTLWHKDTKVGCFRSIDEAADNAVEMFGKNKTYLLNHMRDGDVFIERTGTYKRRMWFVFCDGELVYKCFGMKETTKTVRAAYGVSVSRHKPFNVTKKIVVSDDENFDARDFFEKRECAVKLKMSETSKSNLSRWTLFKDTTIMGEFLGIDAVVSYLLSVDADVKVSTLRRQKHSNQYKIEKVC